MRQIFLALRKRHRQLRARIHVAEQNIRDGVCAVAARIPRFEHCRLRDRPTAWSPAVPVSRTTIVCGFAAATAAINASCFSGNDKIRQDPFLRSSTDKQIRSRHPISSRARRRLPARRPNRIRPLRAVRCACIAFIGDVGNHMCACHLRVRPTRRIDLRRSAARNHSHVRVRPDDRDRVQLGAASTATRRLHSSAAPMLALLDLPRGLESAKHIDNALLCRMIDDSARQTRRAACGEHARRVRPAKLCPTRTAAFSLVPKNSSAALRCPVPPPKL